MTTIYTQAAPPAGGAANWIHWPAIWAGAIAAAGLSFVLHSFAISVGLAVSSTAPTWRDASFALVFLSGLYLVLAAIVAYGFGGYVAGRLGWRADAPAAVDPDYQDGMQGILVWATATLLTAVAIIAAAQVVTRLAAPSGGAAGSSQSVAGENIIAYDLDRLFRSDRRPQGDMTPIRAEAARILLTTSSHRGLQPDDRAYLVRLVGATTGLAEPEATRRVADVTARAKENLDRARKAGVLLGFMLGAAALLGAVAAWYAACVAGRHRDGREPVPALLDWGRTYRGPYP